MKALSLLLVCPLLSAAPCSAKDPASVEIGTPYPKVMTVGDGQFTYAGMEVSIKTTNTSGEAITIGILTGRPCFLEFVRLRKNSRHWTNITMTGGCALGYSTVTLAPGESKEWPHFIFEEYCGKPFRVTLPVGIGGSGRGQSVSIKSHAILVPPLSDEALRKEGHIVAVTVPLPTPPSMAKNKKATASRGKP